MSVFRIGQGFDIHPFSQDPERPLVIGGEILPGPGLDGHSDADLLAHAIADALLGAAGLEDIGHYFPDTEPSTLNANSLEILEKVVEFIKKDGWEICNVDCSVILEKPKLQPYKKGIQERMSNILNAPVTVKGRRAEGLGFVGKGEGAVCLVVALISKYE
tara:strand:- start:17421 stop:17900 length:480 start_codon:yes stop_codon:yes gene_type:complete